MYISFICHTAMLTQVNINAARYFYYDMISWTMDNIGVYPFWPFIRMMILISSKLNITY